MSEKPFYKGKKFVYALATLIAALLVAAVPSLVTLEPETVDMMQTMLPGVLALGLFVIVGHSVNDAIVLSTGAAYKPLPDAAHDMVDALPLEQGDVQQSEIDQLRKQVQAEFETVSGRIDAAH